MSILLPRTKDRVLRTAMRLVKLRALTATFVMIAFGMSFTFAGTQTLTEPTINEADPVGANAPATPAQLANEKVRARRAGQTQPAVLDFDGDHKTDLTLIRNVGGNLTWYTLGSTAGFSTTSWGLWGFDDYVPGDYDGDGKWDVAVWRPSTGSFYILQSATNSLRTEVFGTQGDDALLSQDFDGDGKTDPAVVRASGETYIWYILRSALGAIAIPFGDRNDDNPVRGDFDGDGKADLAVFRGSTGSPENTYFVLPSGGGSVRAQSFPNFDQDLLYPADFDGDGKTDYAMWRRGLVPDSGSWYWVRSSDGASAAQSFGIGSGQSDFILPGDYDGDGKTDHAVWRPTGTPTFYQLGSATGFKTTVFGLNDDDPAAYFLQVRQ